MTVRGRRELLRLAAELGADLEAAERKSQALARWATTDAVGDEVYIPAGLLHHLYTAIESALSRSVATLEGAAPGGLDWHARLLHLSALEIDGVRPALIGEAERDDLRELLEFRHLFRHGYGVALRPERIRELSALAIAAWSRAREQLLAFRHYVEQCAAEVE